MIVMCVVVCGNRICHMFWMCDVDVVFFFGLFVYVFTYGLVLVIFVILDGHVIKPDWVARLVFF